MRLVDIILANYEKPKSEVSLLCPGLREKIKAAQKYALSCEVVQAVYNVYQSRPSSIESAIEFARPPFPLTWIEFKHFNRPRPIDNGRPEPESIGFLIEGALTGMVHLFWNFEYRAVVCPIVFRYSNCGDFTDKIEDKVIQSYLSQPNRRHDPANMSPLEFDSLQRLMARDWTELSPVLNPYYAELIHQNPEMYTQYLIDLAGEPAFLRAALQLMNSRNCIEIERSDFSKLNKARAKRGGEPLCDYSTVKLHLRKKRYVHLIRVGLSEGEIRAYLCRGHFKVRKTGVFWWSPHIRGKGVPKDKVREVVL